MKQKDKKAWMEKNQKINETIDLLVGMEVIDANGHKGVVVKIEHWDGEESDPVENHGTVYVWQSDRVGYGDDNCEHYSLTGWKEFLRLTDQSHYESKQKAKP